MGGKPSQPPKGKESRLSMCSSSTAQKNPNSRKHSLSPPNTDTCPPQINEKLWNRFYEPLVLLLAYGKSQGRHVKSDDTSPEIDLGNSSTSLCKRFLDELAYICDYSPGGDTVAAVAIQDGPQVIYRVAANTNQCSKVKPFLSDILQLLAKVYEANEKQVTDLERQISTRAMTFAAKKLRRYKIELEHAIDEYADALKAWFASLKVSSLDLYSYCRLCYEARSSKNLETVKQRAKASGIEEHNSSSESRFARVRHFIGRLGSHIKASLVLVEAGKHFPRLFTDCSIEPAVHRINFTPPSYRTKSSINGIINRMVTNPQTCDYYQKELRSQDDKFHLELEKRIRDEYKDPKFKLRTHAEIVLLDLFYQEDLRFLDGIRYIGVSKPSCFLCYHYIQAHPLKVQTSGCSNNLYLQWQPPYIQEDSPGLVKEQELILNTMLKGIRLFVLDKIVPDYRGFKSHPDSTTGLGTSVYAHDIGAPNGAYDDPDYATPSPSHNKGKSKQVFVFNEAVESGRPDSPNIETREVAERAGQDSGDDDDDGGVPLY